MKEMRLLIAGSALALAVTACSSVGGSPAAPSSPAPVANNVLQFAVGTANLYGTPGSLNVVVTYRQPKNGFRPGDSGALVDSPVLTLPASVGGTPGAAEAFDGCSTAPLGPAPSEMGTTTLNSTTQNPGAACGTTQTTFGQSGGAFGLGLEPFNATGQADFTPPGANSNGLPFLVAPYPVPLYDPHTFLFFGGDGTNLDAMMPWGGPPAFTLGGDPDSVIGLNTEPNPCNAATGSVAPNCTPGVSEGLDVFSGVAPVAGGAYALSVTVPANTGTVTQKATFTMPAALTVLGTATAPTYTPDGSGGGSFAFTMPTSATEAYVNIVNYGPPSGVSCNGWASLATPIYYTIETTASGAVTLPDTIGPTAPSSVVPAGGHTPSVCTAAQNTTVNGGTATQGDQIVVQLVGFDYDQYGISYPKSLGNPSPSFAAAIGSTDITISHASCQFDAGGGAITSCSLASLPFLRHGVHSNHVK